ncbi:MAG: hypothetical protein Kow0068_26510 [Marinilabiliales bacterium]
MKVERYGVSLYRIRKEDIETVRNWRNSESVRNNMLYQNYITPAMQQKWFESINTPKHSYYIIEYNNEKVGLINIKNSGSNKKPIESGLFIGNLKYANSHIPVISSIILLDTGFYIFPARISYAKVKKDNKPAIKYNESLGYFIYEEKKDYLIMAITKESYEEKTIKLKQAIIKMFGNDPLKFYLTPDDYLNGVADWYMPFINKIPDELIMEKKVQDNSLYLVFNI